ncbi:MAG: 16S rRNA (cytidine(1402)-2'-O)-methyltransferase [Gammaproteobacteria bacterium CG_4_10_14_0_8_um_filter_38_16]|nr:MAG: 16S rRNA (cytidine(1402)-2'-O)-methyltransferase [Gammaproteobacteria bacterium CG_4_10_14_0_8_um_filter_38_16]PJA03811.1 MAG: 16S rRNA (cytidine(1402)-2'-O)-methyltransferase [Gammaproteobacteria bacterium CG_4_10_14_0_2_um_filter_38_22]PJB10785.1 MAG: 16S rRNA (cytidine(1402)-2'-O)-methyltransferase [Gammaproteobacteria bacterium CG_4_9_14_3_um_filter_38_9]
MSSSSLYLVATPIGNLSDMTMRAIEILKSVNVIAAEDTRHSQRLLSHYDIHTPSFSLHDHNEDARIEKILILLGSGKSVALISDAGTPLISDPGFRLVRAVRQHHFKVIPIPGACAAIAALIASGAPTDRFIFEGFLPSKSSALESQLEKLKNETRTLVFYESVHRVAKTLPLMKKAWGADRIVTIARELTKSFETIKQDTIANLCKWIEENAEQKKGEFVIVVSGAAVQEEKNTTEALNALLVHLLSELSVKQAVSLACKISGEHRKLVYAKALQLKPIDNGS